MNSGKKKADFTIFATLIQRSIAPSDKFHFFFWPGALVDVPRGILIRRSEFLLLLWAPELELGVLLKVGTFLGLMAGETYWCYVATLLSIKVISTIVC